MSVVTLFVDTKMCGKNYHISVTIPKTRDNRHHDIGNTMHYANSATCRCRVEYGTTESYMCE
jgi:hypothetical protein